MNKLIIICIIINAMCITCTTTTTTVNTGINNECKNYLLKFFNETIENEKLVVTMVLFKINEKIVYYSKGDLIRNGTMLVNTDGMKSATSNTYNEIGNDGTTILGQQFSSKSTFTFYYGEFTIHKDGYLLVGTGGNKVDFKDCKDSIFTGFLWGDLITLHISKLENNNTTNNIGGVNQKCNLTNTNDKNDIKFNTTVMSSWQEGDCKYSQMKTVIHNNGTSTITSLFFKTNLVLKQENSFWNIKKVISLDSTSYNILQTFSLPSYTTFLHPGDYYEFGFIAKGNTIPIFNLI